MQIDKDHVLIFGDQIVFRPYEVSVSQWLDFWEESRDQKLTIGLEEAREEGYDEGFEDGREEGYGSGHDEGYDEGFEEGRLE